MVTETALREVEQFLQRINLGWREERQWKRLDSRINYIADNPSQRFQITSSRNLGDADLKIFGTGDQMGITTLTHDRRFVTTFENRFSTSLDVILYPMANFKCERVMSENSIVPEYMASTVNMLKGAYPDGMLAEDWVGLISIMSEAGMSSRSIAQGFAYAFGGSYIDYLGRIWDQDTDVQLSLCERDRIQDKLKLFGYDQWKDEE